MPSSKLPPMLTATVPAASALPLIRPRGAYRERSPWPDRERLVIHDAAGECVVESTIRADCVTDELLDFALAWLTHIERERARRTTPPRPVLHLVK